MYLENRQGEFFKVQAILYKSQFATKEDSIWFSHTIDRPEKQVPFT